MQGMGLRRRHPEGPEEIDAHNRVDMSPSKPHDARLAWSGHSQRWGLALRSCGVPMSRCPSSAARHWRVCLRLTHKGGCGRCGAMNRKGVVSAGGLLAGRYASRLPLSKPWNPLGHHFPDLGRRGGSVPEDQRRECSPAGFARTHGGLGEQGLGGEEQMV